jgi:hypothetical protein
MGSVGSRDSRKRAVRKPLVLLLVVGALAIGLALGLAGCGRGGDSTTTTTMAPAPAETTTTAVTVAPEETTTTGAILESTTTTSTAVLEETTTTSLEGETTTTEKLSTAEARLPNGHIKAMGFIKKVWEQGGKRYMSIDYAEMLTGEEAVQAAIAAGDIQPGEDLPNDYFIRNTSPETRQFDVSDGVPITTSTWHGEMDSPVTWDVFKSFWSASPPDQEAGFLRDSPWWIERDGQTVVKIDEQYLP